MSDLKTKLSELREIDYTALDYETLQSELIDYIRSAQSAQGITDDFLEGDAAKVFIDLFSYLGELLAFRIETLAQEAFLPTANRRQSVINLLELVAIKPTNSKAARLNLTAIPESISSTDIIIPARTQIFATGLDGQPVTFEVMNDETDYYTDIVIPAGVSNYIITAFSGNYASYDIESTGEPNLEITLPQFPVIDGSVRVSISSLPIDQLTPAEILSTRAKEVTSLVDPSQEFIYVVRYDADGRATLTFASERFGKIPPRGWTIHVDYRYGGGSATNISAGAIDATYSFNNLAGESISIRLTNPDSPAAGGADPEPIEDLKLKVPLLVKSNDNLVTVEDYVAVLTNIPGIQDVFVVDAYTDNEVYGGKFGVPDNSVFIWVLPDTLGEVNPDLRQIIYQELYKRRLVAIENYVFDPIFKNWQLAASIAVKDGYDKLQVKNAVVAALLANYGGQSIRFNNVVRVSHIISTINGIPGVDYVTLHTPSADIYADENEALRLLESDITINIL